MYKFSKNRASVAASILQNVEVLKSAYETSSTQFQGSAQQELDKYLDSITAKLQQFTNEVHEFWTGLIDSDVVKFFVELGTQLLNLVNNAGQLRVALTGLVAILTTKQLGVFGASIQEGRKQLQFFGKDLKSVGGTIQQVFSGLAQWIKGNLSGNNQDRTFSSYFSGIFSSSKLSGEVVSELKGQYESLSKLMSENVGESAQKLAEDLGGVDQRVVNYINNTSAAQRSSQGFVNSLSNIGLKSKLASAGLSILSAGLNALVVAGISFVTTKAWEAFDNYIHRAERAKQAVQDLENEFSSAQATISDHQKTIDGLKDRYVILSKGVDKFGNNISLTTDEFNEYHDITKQIYDMYPSLISGFTAQGDAIDKVRGNVEKLNEELDKEKILAYNKVLEGSDTVIKNYNTARYNGANGSDQYRAGFYQDILDTYMSADNFDAYKDLENELTLRWAQAAGKGGSAIDALYEELRKTLDVNHVLSDEDAFNNNEFRGAFISKLKTEILSAETAIDEAMNSVINDVLLPEFWVYLLNNEESVINSNENLAKFVDAFIRGIDEDIVNSFNNGSDAKEWVDAFLGSIENAMVGKADSKELSDAFNVLFGDGFKNLNLSPDEYVEAIETAISSLKTNLNLGDEFNDIFSAIFDIKTLSDQADQYDALLSQIFESLYGFKSENYKDIGGVFKEAGIVTVDALIDFYDTLTKAQEKGSVTLLEAIDLWKAEVADRLNPEDEKLSFSSLFSADSDAKDTISAFKTNIKQLGEAIANFQSLSPEEKTNIFETYAVGLEQMGFSGELTVDALQALANQQWQTVDALFDGVEGADEYRKALKALMDQAMNTGAGFKGSLESIAFGRANALKDHADTTGNKDDVEEYREALVKAQKEYQNLLSYTRFFTDEQKTSWAETTAGAKTAREAIQKWEQNLNDLSFNDLGEVLNDGVFQSVRTAAEQVNEVLRDEIIDSDEIQQMKEQFYLTDEEIQNGALTELQTWLNDLVKLYLEKGGEAGEEFYNGWVSEQKKGTFSQIIDSIAGDTASVRQMSRITEQAKLLSNTERDLFVKNYQEGDTFDEVLQKIERDFRLLNNLDFPDLLNSELFSSAREEAEELSAILENGVTGDEGTTLLEKWGFTDEAQAQAELERLTKLVTDAANAAGIQGATWADNWIKGMFDNKRQLSLSDIFDLEFSYEKDGKQITQTLDAYTSEIVSKAQTIGSTLASVTSKASDSNHKTWADIFGDADALKELEAVIPGITTEIGKATQNESYSATVTNILVDAMSKLYDEYSTNTSTIRENKNLTEEASDALDRQNQIVKDATIYNIALKNGLRDVADNLDSIYFDGAYDSARSFGQAIEDIKGELDTLNTAYTQLIDGSLRENSVEFKNLVVDLTNQFPQLVGHTDSIHELAAAVAELMGTKSDSFIVMLDELRNREGIPDELRAKIDNLRESFQKLGSQPFSMDNAISVIKNARQELNQLADFMHEVNETGLHLDIDATDDVYNLYPELLKNAKIYRDGTIELNKDVYEAFIAAKQAEVQGDIDARIKELQARNEVYRRMIELEQKKVQIANEAMKATSLIAMQGAMNEIAAIDEELKAEAEKNLDVAQMDADTTQQKLDNSDLETKHDVENLQTQGDAFAEEATQESKIDEQNVQDQIDRDDDEKGNFITNMLDKVKAWFTGATEISDADADLNEQEQTNSAQTSETQQENDIAAGKTALGVMGEVSDADKETSETMAGNSEQLKTDITSDGDETGSAIVDGINQTDSTLAGAAYNAESNMAQSAEAIKGTINNLINLSHQFADAYAAAAQGKRAGNTTGVVGVLGGMLGGLKQGFKSIKKGLGGVFDSFMSPFKSTASSIGSWFSGSGSGSYGSVKKDLWTSMTDGIKKGVDNLTGAFTTASEKAAEVIEGIGDGAKTIVTKAQEFGIKLTTGIKDGDALKAVTTAIMKAGNWIAEHSGAGKLVSEEIANRYTELVANLKDIEKNSQDKIAEYADEIAKNEELINWLKANGGLDPQEIGGKKFGDTGDNGGNDGGSSGRDSNPDGGSSGRDGDNGQEDKEEEQYSEMIDWIEVRIQRLERVINKLDKVAGNSFENFQTRNKAIGMEIEAVKEEFDDTAKAFQRYMAEADAVPLDEAYKQKIQRGLIDIETITDENLKKNIEEYQTWLIIATLHGDMYVKFYLIAGKPLEVYYHNIMMRNA